MVHYIDSFPGPHLVIDNKEYRYFGGTAYLGLQLHTQFQALFKTNITRYGTGYGASRKSNIRLSIYNEVETFLANWVGSEICATFSSGYLSGQLLAQQFNTDNYKTFYAPNCHSALFSSLVNGKPPKAYITYTSLEIALRQHLELNSGKTPVVFLDAITASGTNYPNFEGLKSLPLDELILVVDDSHGIGVVGHEGAGVFAALSKLNTKELIVCCSLGKALGIQAGAVFCKQARYNQLTATDFYAGASPAAPAYLATLHQGWKIVQEQRSKLKSNINRFMKGVKNTAAFRYIEDHPAYEYRDQNLSAFLFENQVIVTDFAYPNESSEVNSRIVLNSLHQRQDIDYLLDLLLQYQRFKAIN